MLAGIGGTIAKTDAAVAFAVFSTTHNGPQCIVIIHKRAQSHAKRSGNLDQWTQRRQVLIGLYTRDLFYSQSTTLSNLFYADVLCFPESFDFGSYDGMVINHKKKR